MVEFSKDRVLDVAVASPLATSVAPAIDGERSAHDCIYGGQFSDGNFLGPVIAFR